MSKDQIVNIGGINGLGESLVNTNSKEFISLKEIIKKNFDAQKSEHRIENGLLSIRFQIESYLNADLKKEEIKPAGYFVEQLLKTIGISKKQFSTYIGYEYSNFIAVLKGRRKINSDLALKLGQIFKIDPTIWLHLESKNELLTTLTNYEGSFSLHELLKDAS